MLEVEADIEIPNYFKSNLLECRGVIGSDGFKKFASLDSNAERVAFILRHPEAYALPLEIENCLIKDYAISMKIKEAGNKYYGKGDYSNALESYSKSIIISPKKDMGIFLGNRSAVLYTMENHELSLKDIEEAILHGYPQELMYKIQERRARCCLALKRTSQAIEAFKKALTCLDDAKLTFEKKQKIEMDIRIMLKVIEKGTELNEKSRDKIQSSMGLVEKHQTSSQDEQNVIHKITECNPLYPSMSSAMEIREGGAIIGRYGVATRDIMPGELLMMEKPYSSVLLSEYRLSNCHRCMKKNIAPYPANCDKCIIIAYCSPKCRDEDKVHAMECNIVGPLWLSRVSITSVMAIRAVLQNPWNKLKLLKEDYKKSKGKFQPTPKQPFKGTKHLAFWSLVTHEDERTADDMFHRAYMAAWLLRLLKITPYLPKESMTTPDEPLSEDELFIADLILHHLQLVPFNAHEISELVRPKGERTLLTSKSNFIGGGIYPTPALLNHSCNPGVIRYFIGTTMVIRAIRTIRAGEEVCDNYGPAFMSTSKADRQRRLRRNYWFECNCEACAYNWPTSDEINPKILRFKCETGSSCGNVLPVDVDSFEFMLHCSKCNKSTNIMMGLKSLQDTAALFINASDCLENNENSKALDMYIKILKLLEENLAFPIKDYYIAQRGIKLILLSKGNTCVA